MYLSRWQSSKLLIPGLFVAVVLASLQLTQAKSIRSLGFSNFRNTDDAIKMRRGGCAAFGHSCFGGHGKRSELISNPMNPPMDADDGQASMDGIYRDSPTRSLAEVFGREQPENDPEEYLRLTALFRKWLANGYQRDFPINNN